MSAYATLGDVADVVAGVGFPKEMQGQSVGDVPVFKVGDISNAVKSGTRYLRSSPNHLSKEDARKLAAKLMPIDTIVFAKIGEGLKLNRRAILAQPSLVDNNVMGLIPKSGLITSAYLYWFMQTVELGDLSRATAVPSVRKSDVIDIPIPLPDLQEQADTVAEIEKQFSRLDEAVANLKRVKANLKRYKAAVLKAAVKGCLVPTEAVLARKAGRTYETGSELLQRIIESRREQEDSKGKLKKSTATDTVSFLELPSGWAWAALEQLGELDRGKSKHRPRDDPRLFGGPYPFIQTGDVRKSEGMLREHHQTYSEFGLTQSRLWPTGTLCITIAANIAETGFLAYPACFPDSVVGFLANRYPVLAKWAHAFIAVQKDHLTRFASATAQKNINLDVLRNIAIPLPPLVEQQRIVDEIERRLSLVREVEVQTDANLKRAERMRQAVLQTAFTAAPVARQ